MRRHEPARRSQTLGRLQRRRYRSGPTRIGGVRRRTPARERETRDLKDGCVKCGAPGGG